MDRRKAIEYVKQAFAVWQSEFCTLDGDWSKETEALDLAIEALGEPTISEKESVEGDAETAMSEEEVDYCNNCPYISWGGDCISRQQTIEAIDDLDWCHVNKRGELVSGSPSEEEAWYKAVDVYKAIESLPPVEPKPVCEDAVSKGELMTSLQGIWDAYTPNNMTDFQDMLEDIHYKIKNAPLVTPTVSEDCISRAEALDEFKKDYDDVFDLMTAIEELPSVIPTERTGEWKHDGSDWENRWVCSECGYKLFEEQTNYCPNCGAKMGGDTE